MTTRKGIKLIIGKKKNMEFVPCVLLPNASLSHRLCSAPLLPSHSANKRDEEQSSSLFKLFKFK